MPSILSKLVNIKGSWETAFLKNIDLGIEDSVEKSPYTKSELVYICISTTARAIGQVPIQILRPTTRVNMESWKRIKVAVSRDFNTAKTFIDSKELEPVPDDNPYQLLLEKPNDYTNSQLFKESLIGCTLLDGNVWMLPMLPMSYNVEPVSIWVIRKHNIEPVKSNNGQLDHWNYIPNSSRNTNGGIHLSINDIMHIKLWNPYDLIMGLSPMDPAKVAMRSDFKSSVYNEKFFDNSAVPEGVLSTPQRLGNKQFARASEQFEQRHGGYKKSHKIALLEQDLKFVSTGLSQKDMEFLDLRKYNRDTIMQILGMKKAIISVTEDINYATGNQQRKQWWQDTNIPLMKLITTSLNFGLLWNTPYIARWDISGVEALQEDYHSKVKTAKVLWDMGFTANELNERFELGFTPKDWRDYAYAPLSQGVVNPLVDDTIDINEEDVPEEDLDKFGRYIPEPKRQTMKLISAPINVKEKITKEQDQKTWVGYTRELAPYQEDFTKKVSRVFYHMRKKTLDMLYNEKSKDISDITYEEYLEEQDEISKITEQLYFEAVKLGGESVLAELPWSMEYPEVTYFLYNKKIQIKGTTRTVVKALRHTLAEGVDEGDTIPQIAQRIKDVFNASTKRATTIARTEIIGASNFGRNVQLRQSGFPKKKWYTAMDELVRQDHAAMQAMDPIPIDNNWVVGGSTLRFPGDPTGNPRQIINCRCIEIPVE